MKPRRRLPPDVGKVPRVPSTALPVGTNLPGGLALGKNQMVSKILPAAPVSGPGLLGPWVPGSLGP
jgi:hypothetical protein